MKNGQNHRSSPLNRPLTSSVADFITHKTQSWTTERNGLTDGLADEQMMDIYTSVQKCVKAFKKSNKFAKTRNVEICETRKYAKHASKAKYETKVGVRCGCDTMKRD